MAEPEEFNYFGNVAVGKDITVDELKETHHAVIITMGAETDRKLGIPGEDLKGSHTATEFVAWYNGHPEYRERQFDLSHETCGNHRTRKRCCRRSKNIVKKLLMN